ncbi:MAG TPA: LacI family DNA-binding transcriptional regulator [Paenibacillus sp.]|uniref:LacI family DNA-binding transcriptional regulator n=1 Tax=Paenibacillus sp. TaxID=58172 RepID=UPI002BB9C7C4|nr:LacI family DNA-binding transcriptional regulator [Paenibacillus sp.]HUC91697.1 LacI family DNA-binding transcriptional regulator [Paenibacillus sp.]
MKRPTLKDVAKAASVSTAAVSYVLNGKHEKVSGETLERINNVIKSLNYVPDYSARSLVKNQSKLIGIVIPQTEKHAQLILENPWYSEIISGIEGKLREYGYHLLLSGVNQGESYLDVLIQRNLDGAIIMGIYPEEFYAGLKKIKIPIVLIDSYINDSYFYRIGIDDEHGGYLATKYLIDMGHTNIGMITGAIRREGVVEKRFLGYKRAIRESNLFYNPDYVFEDSMSYDHGVAAGRRIASAFPEITAVFATADMIAFGLIKSFTDEGIRTPDDISVIGFDDVFMSKMFLPPLTTVRQDIKKKGVIAAERLLRLIGEAGDDDGGQSEDQQETILPLEIVERGTVIRRGNGQSQTETEFGRG